MPPTQTMGVVAAVLMPHLQCDFVYFHSYLRSKQKKRGHV